MKYLKLFEDNKTEDKEIIDAFEICFQDLKDKGYIVKASVNKYHKIYDFHISIHFHKKYHINDIKENLLLMKSYSNDELNLTIKYLEIDGFYYKKINDISNDKKIDTIYICLIKI